MARNRLLNLLQTHRFWLVDVTPSPAPPFFVLGAPFLAFSSISAIGYSANIEDIRQMNSMFTKKDYTGGSVDPITLSRGVRGWDDSMWQWMKAAIAGSEVTSRNLLLVQFTGISAGSLGESPAPLLEDTPFEGYAFLPGKAWLLWDCIPARYTPSSAGFDAASGAVAISELEVHPWAITEFKMFDQTDAFVAGVVDSARNA